MKLNDLGQETLETVLPAPGSNPRRCHEGAKVT
jgi:hypothetical protein